MTSNPIIDAMEKGQSPQEVAAEAPPSPPISPLANTGSGLSSSSQKLLCRLGVLRQVFPSLTLFQTVRPLKRSFSQSSATVRTLWGRIVRQWGPSNSKRTAEREAVVRSGKYILLDLIVRKV